MIMINKTLFTDTFSHLHYNVTEHGYEAIISPKIALSPCLVVL